MYEQFVFNIDAQNVIIFRIGLFYVRYQVYKRRAEEGNVAKQRRFQQHRSHEGVRS